MLLNTSEKKKKKGFNSSIYCRIDEVERNPWMSSCPTPHKQRCLIRIYRHWKDLSWAFSSTGWEASSLLGSSHNYVSQALQELNHLFGWTHPNMSMCLSPIHLCLSALNSTQHFQCISPVLSTGEGSISLNLFCSPRAHHPSFLWKHIAGSHSFWCSPVPHQSIFCKSAFQLIDP